jgi:hypothetical protein
MRNLKMRNEIFFFSPPECKLTDEARWGRHVSWLIVYVMWMYVWIWMCVHYILTNITFR